MKDVSPCSRIWEGQGVSPLLRRQREGLGRKGGHTTNLKGGWKLSGRTKCHQPTSQDVVMYRVPAFGRLLCPSACLFVSLLLGCYESCSALLGRLWHLRGSVQCVIHLPSALVLAGLGPDGELKYPAHPWDSRWTFPGVGEFQVGVCVNSVVAKC